MPTRNDRGMRRDERDGSAVRKRHAHRAGPPGALHHPPSINPELLPLLDLLGARLAFERASVRLYAALIAEHDRFGDFAGGPRRRDLVHMRDEEHAHARMLEGLIAELGGDPTALTPCAKRELVATRGLADVLVDPRTSLLDGLDTIVLAELADHEQWAGLVELVRDLGRDDLARIFISAQTTEGEHLSNVRRWISAGRVRARDQVSR